MPSELKYEGQKVNNCFSELARWILLNAGDGIDRADLVARYFRIERLYCGFYVDPCFTPKERHKHEDRYRRAQSRVTMTLKRLKQRGLVHLIHPDKYIKAVALTEKGALMAQELSRASSGNRGE